MWIFYFTNRISSGRGVVVIVLVCHAGDTGSIPCWGNILLVSFFPRFFFFKFCILLTLQESIAFHLKTSLTFKCLIEHLLADFSYSRPLDTYLWKQMMKMNRNIPYKWCNIAKKHLLFTKRKCHKFSWLFTASRYSPRRRSICACRIACKIFVSIDL